MFWDKINDDLLAHFKVSPVAVNPQTGYRGRIILDLSYPVGRPPKKGKKRRTGEVVQDSVNDTTHKHAPTEPIHEIVKVLPHLFHFVTSTPEDQYIRLIKVALLESFSQSVIEPVKKWNFCYVMSDMPGARVRIVVPSAIQMGWAKSPAYLCTAAKTGQDIIDLLLREGPDPSEHPPNNSWRLQICPQQHLQAEDQTSRGVYMDDYVLGVIENDDWSLIMQVLRATLHIVHPIFLLPESSGYLGGNDPISRKKLEKGDTGIDIEKEILQFMLNGADRTMRLSEANA